MKKWIWPVTQENWEIVVDKEIWAVKNEVRTKKAVKNDYIIFYVKKSGSFKGIFQIVSDWYQSKDAKWSDEDEGLIKYPFECKLKKIQLGDAVFNELMPKLNFVKGRTMPYFALQAHTTGPANYGQPIEDADYQLIFDEMLEEKAVAEVVEETTEHEDIIAKLQEIGTILGFEPYTDLEHTHVAKGCVVDLVWDAKIASIGLIKYVFEIQSRGVKKSLITNLIQSINNPLVKKVIAVSDDKQLQEIKDQISQMSALSESSKQMFVYLNFDTVNKIYDILPTLQDFKSQLQLL